MKNKNLIYLTIGAFLLILFVVFTAMVKLVDVQETGPLESSVGFSSINTKIRDTVGANMILYNITDWLGIIPILISLSYAIFGLLQLIKRKSIFKMDKTVLLLGAFYITVIFLYLLFEMLAVNYRPILIDGRLEASYPSSTTLLTLTVIPSSIIDISYRVKNKRIKILCCILLSAFSVFMLLARILSGVHWFTDIIGGVLLSSALVLIYYSFVSELYSGQE